jgi:hypothetical protein
MPGLDSPGPVGGLDVRGWQADTGTVGVAAEWIAAILLPTALGFGMLGAIRALRWAGERRARPPAVEPIERLSASLRRLRAELEDLETRPDVPYKSVRLQALRGAYLDALTVACARLEISPPNDPHGSSPRGRSGRVPLAEIYRVEAALRQRGLDVREAAAR